MLSEPPFAGKCPRLHTTVRKTSRVTNADEVSREPQVRVGGEKDAQQVRYCKGLHGDLRTRLFKALEQPQSCTNKGLHNACTWQENVIAPPTHFNFLQKKRDMTKMYRFKFKI